MIAAAISNEIELIMWSQEQVCSLIESKSPEGNGLEFKRDLPGNSDRERAEFLKDVSAMANASGGSIIYGIEEKHGSAFSLSGIRLENIDSERRRLAQMLETGIEPRLSGVSFDHVGNANGDVLIATVPESFDQPHRYLFNGHSRFVKRNGTHISELSFDQLRSAFEKSSKRIEEIRLQWDKDLSVSDTWLPIISGPVCVVRLSPIISADRRQLIDPKDAYSEWSKLIFSNWGGGSPAFNYQGLAVFPSRGSEELTNLVQVYRNGAITAFRSAKILNYEGNVIPSQAIGSFILEATSKLTNFLLSMGLRGGAILNVGLSRLTDYAFAVVDGYGFEERLNSVVDDIRMPDVWIDDLAHFAENALGALRPGFDLLWQAYGKSDCPHFDAEGRWSPR